MTMSSDQVEKISIPLLLEIAASLPASPRIYARLSKLVDDEDTALDYVASLVKMDPGLAAQILRVTNSAYYGGSVKINDIETAISRIGFKEVQKVMSMVVSHECFYQALPVYGLAATDFSNESINVAVASEILAKRVASDPNAPYLAGLLHCIGKLAINLYLEKMDQVVDISQIETDLPMQDLEKEVFGITSWRAGYELLRHWQFEPEIWNPIKNQNAPPASPSFVRSTALLTTAIWISQQLNGYDSEAEMPKSIRWALGNLEIDALDVAPLIDDTRFEVNDRQNLFSMLI